MAYLLYEPERQFLAETMRLLFERKLTNAAGGNAAVRVSNEHILVTPSMMSEHHHCRISAANILVCDCALNVIEGNAVPSRECRMHAKLLKNIPEIGAVIHAHPEYTMVFVAQGIPVPAMTEATDKMGACGVVRQAKAYSEDLADHVYDYFMDKREQLSRTGLCALLPRHGTVCVGKHLAQAFSVAERVECDAKCAIFGSFIAPAATRIQEEAVE